MVVAIVPSILFPPKKAAPRPGGQTDTISTANRDTALPSRAPVATERPSVGPSVRPSVPTADAATEKIVTVETPLYRYSFSSHGARLVGSLLKSYRSFAPGDTFPAAQIIPDSSQFLSYGVVIGLDTLNLAEWNFEPSTPHLDVQSGANELQWTGRRGDVTVTLRYHFSP